MKRPELSLKNKSALVTGAAGGLGEAIVRVFASAGARVFLNGTREEKLKAISRKLTEEGAQTGYMALDITKPGAPEALVEKAIQEMGKIDILVNSAGINRPQKPEDITETNWDDIYKINVKAMFFVSQAVGKEMLKKGGGKIINIGSQAGIIALPLRVAYCSSKGAVHHMTKTLAYEWAPHNVLVNAVAPTFVRTPFTEGMLKDKDFKEYVLGSIPLGRMPVPEDIGYAALFLASDLASSITGHILTVDGGWTIK